MKDTQLFNTSSRTKNSVKSSILGATGNVFNIIMGFVYRSIFLYILSANYLGINGLFSNILQVLSLAELGITTAITYKFYDPISKNNIIEVGKLMNYFKIVYRGIAAVILSAGLVILPFVNYLVNDASEIPNDVNMRLVYLLFLLNTVASYLFVYKQTLLSADQKNYIVSLFHILTSFSKYLLQILSLIIFKNFTLTLLIGIVTTLLINYVLSLWVTVKYKAVFEIKETISKEQKKEIFQDTKSCMLHKVGATVKIGTDSIVLTKLVSLVATGLYSNYSLIINNLQTFLTQLLGNFVSSIGDAHVKLNAKDNYKIYKKLLFLDLWISVVVTGCVYVLINDFIDLWLGQKYTLNQPTVIMLCIQFYISISRIINVSYTNGCGLFVKDKFRPIIEAILNLVISIVLAKYIGIAGVFAGTVISSVLTILWREPLILYKNEFKEKVHEYWIIYISFFAILLLLCTLLGIIKSFISLEINILFFITEAIVVFITLNLFLYLFMHKKNEYSEFVVLVKKVFLFMIKKLNFLKLNIKNIFRKL